MSDVIDASRTLLQKARELDELSTRLSNIERELGPLEAALDGELITPDSAAYEAARRPALARFHDVRPMAVVRCASARDVARTLAYARHSGTHVVPRGGLPPPAASLAAEHRR